MVEKLLEFEPDEDFLKNIQEDDMYSTILRTYYGISVVGKPKPIEMLPAIYMGATIRIDAEDTTTYWPESKYKDKLDYILNLIDDEELTNSYKVWTKSSSMMKDILRFAYGFDYTLFNEDIYKRILYNKIFS